MLRVLKFSFLILLCATGAFAQYHSGGTLTDTTYFLSGFQWGKTEPGQRLDLAYADIGSLFVNVLSATTLRDSVGVRDTVEAASFTLTGTWTFVGPTYLPAENTKVIVLDTTITSTSVLKMLGVNLYDPNENGVYNANGKLVSAYQPYRTAEMAHSAWAEEQVLHPDLALGIVSAGGDSFCVWNALTWDRPIEFHQVPSAFLHTVDINDVMFKDMRWWLPNDGGIRWFDFWSDVGYGINAYREYGYPKYSNRHVALSGHAIGGATVVDVTVHSGGVCRSPFAGAAGQDEFGRQRPVFSVGTTAGQSVSGYDSRGNLHIYDSSHTNECGANYLLYNGDLISVYSTSVTLQYNVLKETGDSWVENRTFKTTNPAGNRTPFSGWKDAAGICGLSSAGNRGDRIYAVGDNGMLIIDNASRWGRDNAKQEITRTAIGPNLLGEIVVGFSGASSANYDSLTVPWSEEGTPAYTVNDSCPGSHYMDLDGSETLWLSDADVNLASFTTLMVSLWHRRDGDSASDETIIAKWNGDVAGSREFKLKIEQDDNTVQFSTRNTGGNTVTSVGPVIDQATWYYYVATYDGAIQKLYINGDLVDSDAQTGALTNGSDSLRIGAQGGNSGSQNFSQCQVSRGMVGTTLPCVEWIRDEYHRGLSYIASPEPDTLYATDVDYISVDQIGRRLIIGNENYSQTRSFTGAGLSDTLMCSACDSLLDATFLPLPWVDSLAVAFGGTGGFRAITPAISLLDLASAEWPTWSEYWIGNGPAVVDSSGHGHFAIWQYALDSMNNVGLKVVKAITRQTFYDPITSVPGNRMILDGAGSLITNTRSTSNEPITVTADSVTIRDMRFYSAPGGSGGNQDAILWSGGWGVAENVGVLDADDDALVVTGRYFRGTNLQVTDADDDAASIGAGRAILMSPVFSSAGSSITFLADADTCRVVGGDLAGDVHVESGAVKIAIVGTNYGSLTDIGSEATEAGNP